MTKKIAIINGPNLNLLGKRETGIYGKTTLSDIEQQCQDYADKIRIELQFSQHNSESDIIKAIHQTLNQNIDAIIINAAAYTHTSIAIRDALLAVAIPFVEVHISNVFRREPFRHHSYLSDIAKGVICGFGVKSYLLAIDALIDS